MLFIDESIKNVPNIFSVVNFFPKCYYSYYDNRQYGNYSMVDSAVNYNVTQWIWTDQFTVYEHMFTEIALIPIVLIS